MLDIRQIESFYPENQRPFKRNLRNNLAIRRKVS